MGNRPSRNSTRHQSLSRDTRRRAAVAVRHEQARRAAKRKATRRKRLVVAVLLIASLLLVGGGVSYFFVGGGSGTTNYALTAPLAPASDGDVSISTVPTSYQVVYRVQTFGGQPGTSTENITIRRPFDSKLENKSGAPPGGDVQSSLIWTLGKYTQTSAGGGSPTVSGAAPQAALGDMRFDATLQDLIADGSFATRERRVVLGRDCQVYRTGEALETFTVSAATKLDYTDACIDSSGLLLEEVSVSSGQLAERLIATSVDDQTPQADAKFAVNGDPTPVAAGGSVLTGIDGATAPVAGYWHLDTPPAGYQFQGRYLLQTPADSSASSDPTATTTTTTAPAPPISSYVDVYVNGPNTITVRQGPVAGEPTPDTSGGAGTTVDLGALGSANLTISLAGSRLVAHPSAPTGWYVEVMGTVSRSALQDTAKALHS